eukprot:EG_transcript_6137
MFIGRTGDSPSAEEVRKHYAALGADAVTNIELVMKGDQYRGYLFVHFRTPELMQAALQMPAPVFNGQPGIVGNSEAPPPRLVVDQLNNLKERRRKILDIEERISNGETLPDVDWPEDHLQKFPIKKDFSAVLRPAPRTDAEVAAFRRAHHLVAPLECPPPALEFGEVNWGPRVVALLKERFERPTAIQAQAWPVVLAGHDCIVVAETGLGKTLCYALPAILHLCAQPRAPRRQGPVVLVLSPTRELTLQIAEEFRKFQSVAQLRIAPVYGGLDGGGDRVVQGTQLIAGLDVVAATPGRLVDFVEAELVSLRRVTFLVLDEADRMLSLGFHKIVLALAQQTRPDRQTVLLSATWAPDVQQLADGVQRDPMRLMLDRGDVAANPDVKQVIHFADSMSRKKQLTVELLQKERAANPGHRCLVFVTSRGRVGGMVAALSRHFPAVLGLHAHTLQSEREKVMQEFRQNPSAILVATDVAARGLDIPHLDCVINAEMPHSIEQYVHRIGRTGRSFHPGTAHSLLDMELDQRLVRPLIDVMTGAGQPIPDALRERVREYRRWRSSNPYEVQVAADPEEEEAEGTKEVAPSRKKAKRQRQDSSAQPRRKARRRPKP